ncbi:MAG TPA: hypothetical protein VN951_14940 [Pyrinomonadaceae bacterium]|nr:hypothetical protein [Pyrinomonadaceae bacterium]
MGRINYGRLIAGALLAAVFYFIADGTIHGALLGKYHLAAIVGAGYPAKPDPNAYFYFALFDLGKGLVAMLIYVAARSRFGAGVKTAMWAGLVAWLAIEVLPSIEWMPFPFYEKSFFVKVIALELVPMVIGAILGAWIYKEQVTSDR